MSPIINIYIYIFLSRDPFYYHLKSDNYLVGNLVSANLNFEIIN